MLKRLFSVIIITCIACAAAMAQELNAKVAILHEKITGVDPQVFVDLQRAVTSFLNTHKWTNDEFQTNERIDITLSFNLSSKLSGDDNGYSGSLTVQASRPVYNSSYQTTTINFQDRDIQFHYDQFTPLVFDDNNISGTNPLISNLPAVLAYYAYLALGLDYDSFSLMGGTEYFKKAQNIVNNAPDDKAIQGWKAVQGNRNRYWLIDQMLSPRFQDIRSYWYTMHRQGLDNMYNSPDSSRLKILAGLSKISDVNRENPASILIQFFFDAKSDEFTRMLAQMPKESRMPFVNVLSQMDVVNIQKYNTLR